MFNLWKHRCVPWKARKNKSQKGKHRSNDCAEDPKGGAGKSKKPKNGHNFKTNTSGEGKKKFCLCHGLNSTHVTDECKVLKAEADKLKRQRDDGNKESRYNKSKEYKKHSNEKILTPSMKSTLRSLKVSLKSNRNFAVIFRRSSRLLPKRTKRILTLNTLLVKNRS